jgi:hypothetical protein
MTTSPDLLPAPRSGSTTSKSANGIPTPVIAKLMRIELISDSFGVRSGKATLDSIQNFGQTFNSRMRRLKRSCSSIKVSGLDAVEKMPKRLRAFGGGGDYAIANLIRLTLTLQGLRLYLTVNLIGRLVNCEERYCCWVVDAIEIF